MQTQVKTRQQIDVIQIEHPVMPVALAIAGSEVSILTGKTGSHCRSFPPLIFITALGIAMLPVWRDCRSPATSSCGVDPFSCCTLSPFIPAGFVSLHFMSRIA